jgi:UMF1 family MFS transporter
MWLGPLLVETATRIGGSQASGFVPVIGLLALGVALLLFVRGGGRLKAA